MAVDVIGGVVEITLSDGTTHRSQLTAAQVKKAMEAIDRRSDKPIRKNPRLTETEDRLAYRLNKQGRDYASIARQLNVSVACAKNAVTRVKNGRYGSV